ncbi:hypothetical protein RAMDARK_0573 [Rickettsia amblyommatis str. Darkwater]|nr:hypothetical protein RAMDARK_0573 [Rickettsia amblyommatis str. Darkwater]
MPKTFFFRLSSSKNISLFSFNISSQFVYKDSINKYRVL